MSRKQLSALFVCSLVPWVIGNGLLPLLPIYAHDLGADPILVGYYLAFSYLALASGTLVAGWLADRLQRRKLLLILSGLVFIPFLFLMGQVTNPLQLTLLTAVVWFLGGVILTTIGILAGLFAGAAERGRVFGILALTSALGALIGGLASGPIVDRWGFPALFTALTVFSMLLPLAGLLLEDKPVIVHSVTHVKSQAVPLSTAFYLLLLASVVAGTASFVAVVARSLDMNQLHFASAAISSTAAVGGLFGLPLAPLTGRLSDRVNRKMLLVVIYLLGALGLGLLAFSSELWHFWVAAILGQIAGGLGVNYALVTDLVPEGSLGRGYSLFSATNWIGGIVGFGMSGYLINSIGLFSTFLVVAAIQIIAAVVLIQVRQARRIMAPAEVLP